MSDQQLVPIKTSPKYVHLSQRLLRHIAHRNLRPGDYLGTEAELAERRAAVAEQAKEVERLKGAAAMALATLEQL